MKALTEEEARSISQGAADMVLAHMIEILQAGVSPNGVLAALETASFSTYVELAQRQGWSLNYALGEIDRITKHLKDRMRLAAMPVEGHA